MAEWNGMELDGLVLHSGRLTLRPWQEADAFPVETIMADPGMHQFLPLPNPYTAQDAKSFVTELGAAGRRKGTALDCAIAENTTGRVVGSASLHISAANPDFSNMGAELGYWIAVSERGQGYAREATQTLTRFGFANGLQRMQIRCSVQNIASARVALAAGYSFEGVRRMAERTPAGLADGAIFGRVLGDSGDSVRPTWPEMTQLTDDVITIRPMTAQDWPALLAEQTNPESLRWSLTDGVMTESVARTQAARAPLDWLVGWQTRLVILDAESGNAAGTIALRRGGPPDVVLIGYGLLPEWRGRRITARALGLLSDWAFHQPQIARLELGCKVDNVASSRSAELAGFVREGIYRGRLRNPDGTFTDEARYAKLR
jgi:RimJ/RimL family protein N-acetyltransferase